MAALQSPIQWTPKGVKISNPYKEQAKKPSVFNAKNSLELNRALIQKTPTTKSHPMAYLSGGSGEVKSATDDRSATTSTYSAPTTSTNNTSGGGGGNSGGDSGGGRSVQDMINDEFDGVLADLDRQAQFAQQSIVPQRQLLSDAYQGNLNETGLRQQNEQAALKSALNDYSQRGIARFSLTGGFGSSSGEALAERLGRYAMQEQSKLQNGYATMRNKLAQSYQTGLADLEGQLQQRLSTIDSLKTKARSEKARAVYDAWQSYTNQVAQFNQTMAQYDASLRQIAAEKSGNLGLLVNNQPNFFDRKNFGIMSPVEPVGEMNTIVPGQGIPATVYSQGGTGTDDEDIYDLLQNYQTFNQ